MKSLIRKTVETALALTPYTVSRRGAKNRFQAIEDVLDQMKERGFRPTRIVDGGANTGAFAREARQRFPEAVLHLIEPQPGCAAALRSLARREPDAVLFHPFALAAPDTDGEIINLATDMSATSTGAHITFASPGGPDHVIQVEAITLDRLLAPHLAADDSILLKLDLQGFELEALKGARAILDRVGVVLTEASFFAQAYKPPISELVAFLAAHGFELYDVASLSHRARDKRARQADFVFVRRNSPLDRDRAWA